MMSRSTGNVPSPKPGNGGPKTSKRMRSPLDTVVEVVEDMLMKGLWRIKDDLRLEIWESDRITRGFYTTKVKIEKSQVQTFLI